MKIVKFEGATMREALARVKAELGDQAVVVSTRPIRRGLLGSGYEIAAAIDPDDGPAASEPRFTATAAGAAPRRAATATTAPVSPGISRAATDDLIAPVKAELRSLRAMIRAADDGRATSELRTELAMVRRLVERLGKGAADGDEADVDALARTTQISAASDAGVVALVGPTGVGKTTTIAKIAARAALVDGRSVAIITLDNYRVGGADQIRTFADLIGVPLAIADRPSDLAEHVDAFDGFDLVLVDTAGRSPRDGAAIDELSRALGRVRGLEVHLALAAATAAASVDDLVKRYGALAPRRLLFTKLDETDAAPEVVRAPARHGLPVTWLGTGQAVPEDLEEATGARLVELATQGLRAHTQAA